MIERERSDYTERRRPGRGSVMREVTLVTGPPCAGKSTHVQQHAQPGDLVVCLDQLAQAAGSPYPHVHSRAHFAAATLEYDRLVDHVAAAEDIRAWIIRCAPAGAERAALAHRARATRTLVLAPPLAVTLARARSDRRRRIQGVIRGWYRRYTPADGDTLVTSAAPAATAPDTPGRRAANPEPRTQKWW